MAYKGSDEKDIEQGLKRSRSPQSSHTQFPDPWRIGIKESINGARAPPDNRYSAIWIPGGLSNPPPAPPAEPQLRKFADPAPLGLFAAALPLFVLSLTNISSRGVSEPAIMIGIAYAYGGLVQLLAGMWEFVVGETFGAMVFSSLGGFWIGLALLETPSLGLEKAYASKADLNNAVGLFLIAWFVFGVLCTLCTLKSNLAFFLLFVLLDLTFLILSIAHFNQAPDGSPGEGLTHVGGYLGLATAVGCWYNAMAILLDDSNSYFTVPVFPFPWSKKAQEKKA